MPVSGHQPAENAVIAVGPHDGGVSGPEQTLDGRCNHGQSVTCCTADCQDRFSTTIEMIHPGPVKIARRA
jgi:hypothetical protein